MKVYYEEDHGGGERREDVPLSMRDARLQSDLEAIVDEQKQKVREDSIGTQIDAVEHQRLAEEAMAELTDTSEAHIYLRVARDLIPEKEISYAYSEVIKLAIAYVRIGEIDEALSLVDQLDLPTETYKQDVEWEATEKSLNPFSYNGLKKKKYAKRISRWKFKDSQDETYEYYERNYGGIKDGEFYEEAALSAAYQHTKSTHERQFKKQLELNEKQNMPELQGMSPKEYVMAMIAYYSNWMGGISTKENVQKFASTLKDPEKDFEVKYNDYPDGERPLAYRYHRNELYRTLERNYKKNGPKALRKAIDKGTVTQDEGDVLYQHEVEIPQTVIFDFLCDLAVQRYHENQHDIADDEEKELISN